MPRGLDPGSDRHRACLAAAKALMTEYGSGPKVEQATGLKQPTLNNLLKHDKLGIGFADQIAAVFETTVDGLVAIFLRENEPLRAVDIPGWQEAVAEARVTDPDYDYLAASAVVLPVWPRRATREFARDMARIFHDHVRVSSTRPRLLPGAKRIG
jgi:hypothetical protein